MNDSKHEPIPETDPKQEPTQTTPQSDSEGPDAVDRYMRHVGRTLYEIILDWVKAQEQARNAKAEEPMGEDRDVLERSTT